MTLAVMAVMLAGVAARISWIRHPGGQLVWDGDVWRWESIGYQSGSAEYELSVIADFQRILLVRLQNQAHVSLWLWVERNAMQERWLDLRRAVYSPHRRSPSALPSDSSFSEFSISPQSTATESASKRAFNVLRANP